MSLPTTISPVRVTAARRQEDKTGKSHNSQTAELNQADDDYLSKQGEISSRINRGQSGNTNS